MITGATKNKVDDIWQKMWEGGITNPLEVISQLTYLMFMHQLDEKEFELERLESILEVEQRHIFPKSYANAAGIEIPGDELRWSRFKDKPAETMYHTVSEFAFPFIKTLGDGSAFTRSMESATFGIPTPKTLQRAVDGINELFESYVDDISDLGDLYEYMLSKLNTAGTNGQFRTPKHIRDMMVRFIDPKPSQLVCDPAMGTAGFLISTAEYLRQQYESQMTQADWECYTGTGGDGDPIESPQFTGFEIDQTMLRISAMNLMLHGVDMPDVRYLDSISKNNTTRSRYDCILANPLRIVTPACCLDVEKLVA